jgi:hypothetical protein
MATFFVKPPKSDASVETWLAWQENETRKEIANRIKRTKSLPYAEAPEGGMVCVGGVWKQMARIGVVSDGVEGACHLEPVCEASQEKEIDAKAMMLKGRGNRKSGAAKRAALKAKNSRVKVYRAK